MSKFILSLYDARLLLNKMENCTSDLDPDEAETFEEFQSAVEEAELLVAVSGANISLEFNTRHLCHIRYIINKARNVTS